ncbi:MAG: hypothetical protein KJ734_01445, partial [Chloroflexi bacterium]|nr:hypothetical protein [Chloroflexota bacterium]
EPEPEPAAPAEEDMAGGGDLPGWLFLEDDAAAQPPVARDEPEIAPDVPEWARDDWPAAATEPEPEALLPDWAREAEPDAATPDDELPDWVRDMRPPEASPVTPESLAGVTPEDELPEWVRALKPTGVQAAPGEPVALIGPEVLRDIESGLHTDGRPSILPGVRVAKPGEPSLPSADLAANFATTPPEQDPESKPPRKKGGLGGLVQRLMGGVLVLAIALPLVFGTGSAWVGATPRLPTQGFAEAVNTVAPGDTILLIVDYGPEAQEEMDPVLQSALYAVTTRQGGQIMALGMTPEAPTIIRQAIQRVAPADYVYGEHYAIAYLPGEEAGLVRAIADLPATVPQDAVNREALDRLPVAQSVSKITDARLVLLVGSDQARLERWIVQLAARTGGQPPLVVASSTAASPMLRAYWDTHQVAGILEGIPGAAEYESTVLQHPGTATNRVDALLYGHLAVIAFILLGNLAFVLRRLVGP